MIIVGKKILLEALNKLHYCVSFKHACSLFHTDIKKILQAHAGYSLYTITRLYRKDAPTYDACAFTHK
jgi:hypothetical protein